MPAAGWTPADGAGPQGFLRGPQAQGPRAHADVRISNMSLILRSSELVGDTGRHPDRMIEHVAAMLSQALDELTRQGTTVPGIVLAQPGIIDYANDTVRYSSTLGRYDVALVDKVRDAIARRTGSGRDVPVITLENDAKLAALATYERHAPAGVRNLLYLSGGEGIGAGIIADGHLLRGWLGLTGEVGHMPVEPEGLLCRCGRRGCWETRSGPEALTSVYPPDDTVRDETAALEECIDILRRRFDAGDAELEERIFCAHDLPAFAHDVERVSWEDCCKVYFTGGGWVTIRFSGTEPLLRVFAEMSTGDEARTTAAAVAGHYGLDA